jgi:hypothetical protein
MCFVRRECNFFKYGRKFDAIEVSSTVSLSNLMQLKCPVQCLCLISDIFFNLTRVVRCSF